MITKLALTNFRNYKNQVVEFSPGLNVLLGKNAQGKTNLLEAIYFCAIGKSHRVSKEKELILWNENFAKISVDVQRGIIKSNIEILFSKNEKKTIKLGGISIKKIGDLLGEMNAVHFSPEELKLVKESPEDRRRFLDIANSQISKSYFSLLGRYEKALANRNKLLKMYDKIENVAQTIGVWNEQLAVTGSKIIKQRRWFCEKLFKYAKLAHSFLSSNTEDLSVSLQCESGQTEQEFYNNLLQKLNKNLEKDFKLGYTTIGPHRDDIKILIDNIDVRTYGSQGQQRTAALSLKLAELEIAKEEKGEYPILLLDDVLGELDQSRQKRLIKFTEKTQTIVTCNSFDLNFPCNLIHVENGKVAK
ncbi:MAG: DNA replication/repair protein RecF [Clostridia bacterium]